MSAWTVSEETSTLLDDEGDWEVIEIADGEHQIATLLAAVGDEAEIAETRRRAALIAAAPETTDALQAARDSAKCGCSLLEIESGHLADCWLPRWLGVADAALRKAGRLP